MKLRSVLTALLVSMSLAAVPACKKDKKKADDKAGETTTTTTDDKAGEKPAGDMAGGEAKAGDPAAGGEAKAGDPAAAGGEPTEVKKDEAAAGKDGEKKEGGW